MPLGWIGPRRRRQIAGGLVAYGIVGLLVLGLTSIAGASSLGTIAPLTASLESERLQLVETLRSTSRAIDVAASSVTNLNQSLDQARTSSGEAAGIARSVALSMRSMADAMGLEVFGTRPFAILGDSFRQTADQLDGLGKSLDNVTQALGQNRTDLASGSAGMSDVRSKIDTLGSSIASMAPLGDPTSGTSTLRFAFVVLVLWLAVPAFVSLIAGVLLWRTTRQIRAEA